MEKKILQGEIAKQHFNEVIANHKLTDEYKHPIDRYVSGGFWREKQGDWVAFDNNSGECTIESFSSYTNALKYAMGKETITKNGMVI